MNSAELNCTDKPTMILYKLSTEWKETLRNPAQRLVYTQTEEQNEHKKVQFVDMISSFGVCLLKDTRPERMDE